MYNAAPEDRLTWFKDMRAFWCEAELEALFGLSLLQSRMRPLTAKIRRRTEERIVLNLSRTASRAAQLNIYLDIGYGPADIIADILSRIANTEATLRKMLAITRATAVVRDEPNPRRVITSPLDLPDWLMRLQEWSRPEHEVIANLKHAIANRAPRRDEALDHLQWTAQDDIEAIGLVLRLAGDWDLTADTRAHLARVSAEARTQLEALMTLAEQARPYSAEMRIAQEMADAAKASGQKVH